MARALALAATLAVSLLAVSGASGTAAQTPKRGGTLVIAMGGEPPCLNAVLSPCGSAGDAVFTAIYPLVLPGFKAIAPDGTYRPALSVKENATKGPPFSATYHLHPKARWSDGRPVTARDVVFSVQVARKFGSYPKEHPIWAIQRIVPVDTKTVRVVASRPNAYWRRGFLSVFPRHVLSGRAFDTVWRERIDEPRTGKPIGSGPFLVERWDRGRQLVLRRNPSYWGRRPYLDRIVIRFIRTSAYADALRSGAVDMTDPRSAAGTAVALQLRNQRPPGVRVLSVPGLMWTHLSIRMGLGGHPALRQRLVRSALAYGIDRVAIAREIAARHRESGDLARPLDSVVFLANHPAYEPNWSEYRYRPALAQRLLERAGCRRGDGGIYSCSGQKLSLRLFTTAGAEHRVLAARLVQAQLGRVGIEVVPTFANPGALFFQILPSGAFDLALFAWGDGTDRYGIFACENPLEQNWTGYCQRLATRDLDQARRILDERQRERVLNRADRQIAKDVPVIPVFQDIFLLPIRNTVRGVLPNAASLTWNAENWWLDR